MCLVFKPIDLAKHYCVGGAPRIINGCHRTFGKDHFTVAGLVSQLNLNYDASRIMDKEDLSWSFDGSDLLSISCSGLVLFVFAVGSFFYPPEGSSIYWDPCAPP
jgi:hypothetical protein